MHFRRLADAAGLVSRGASPSFLFSSLAQRVGFVGDRNPNQWEHRDCYRLSGGLFNGAWQLQWESKDGSVVRFCSDWFGEIWVL